MLREAVRYGVKELGGTSTTPQLDAEILLAHVLGRAGSSDAFLLTHRDDVLSAEQEKKFAACIARRWSGVPVAYITGRKEFYGRDFFVDERVLVPRPETELLVDAVKKYFVQQSKKSSGVDSPHILDIGTGSGCIAATLALELQHANVVATDISSDALVVARQNAETLGAQIEFYESDVFANLPATLHHSFDCIVSNPPYVDMQTVDMHSPLSSALAHEPQHALTPGNDAPNTQIIESILHDAAIWLKPHAALCIEIGHDQGEITTQLAHQYFPAADISIQKDLAGFDRMLSIVG